MNIYFIPMFYKDERNPEKAIFVYEQAKALRRKGHHIVVLAVNPREGDQGAKDRIDYVSDEGIHTYYISFPQELCTNRDFSDAYLSQYIQRLEKLIRHAETQQGKPDVLYAHFSLIAGYAASILAGKYQYPLVIEEHHSRIMTEQLGGHDIEVLARAASGADEFICVSDNLRKALVEKTGVDRHIHIIPNMIDDAFRYYPRVNKPVFRFFSLGNLFSRKGFDLLITAFAKEFKTDEPVELIIGGSGPEEAALKALIDQICPGGNITMTGHLNRNQTIEEYKKCDCFALASRCESFGLVYREAMAIGRPIITTNHGGFSAEHWNGNYGIMSEVDDEDGLKRALRTMYETCPRYDPEQISAMCLAQFRADVVISQIERVLKEAATKALQWQTVPHSPTRTEKRQWTL